MEDHQFNELLSSVEEAGKIMSGKKKAARVTKVAAPDTKAIRASLELTQGRFANLIGVSVRTLQNWEQGTRGPTGSAAALLKVAEKHPKEVYEALHG